MEKNWLLYPHVIIWIIVSIINQNLGEYLETE